MPQTSIFHGRQNANALGMPSWNQYPWCFYIQWVGLHHCLISFFDSRAVQCECFVLDGKDIFFDLGQVQLVHLVKMIETDEGVNDYLLKPNDDAMSLYWHQRIAWFFVGEERSFWRREEIQVENKKRNIGYEYERE